MMKQIFILALTILTFCSMVLPAQAGFFDKLTDKVMDRVGDTISDKLTKKAGDKAGEATDAVINPEDSTDKTVGQTTEPTSADASAMDLGGLNGMMKAMQKPVAIDDSYTFPISFVTEVTNDGKTQTINQAMSDNAFSMEVSKTEAMIMDFNNKAMITLDHQKHTKMAMSTDLIKQFAGMAKKNAPEPYQVTHISKTSQSKKILGYTADLWEYQDKDGKGKVWIAKDVNFDLAAYSKKISKIFGDTNGSGMQLDFSNTQGEMPTGYPLETIHYENGKEVSRSKVVKVINQPSTISIKDYQLQSMMGQ